MRSMRLEYQNKCFPYGPKMTYNGRVMPVLLKDPKLCSDTILFPYMIELEKVSIRISAELKLEHCYARAEGS